MQLLLCDPNELNLPRLSAFRHFRCGTPPTEPPSNKEMVLFSL